MNLKFLYQENKNFQLRRSTLLNDIDRESLIYRREQIRKDKDLWKLIKEIFIYLIFLFFALMVAYTNKDPNSYTYQKNILSLFGIKDTEDLGTLKNLKTIDDFWIWTNNSLSNGFDSYNWYNAHQTKLDGYLSDYFSFIISPPMLRQSRVKSESCKYLISKCYGEYSFYTDEKSDFDPYWRDISSTNITSAYLDAFKYKKSSELNSYPYFGLYNLYYGGGYVHRFNDITKNSIMKDLMSLKGLGWIDVKTRAVFIEFSIFNPNVNLFSYCSILFEFLPTGSLLKSYKIQPILMFDSQKGFSAMVHAINIVYIVYIILLMIKEVRTLIKNGIKEYFCHFWVYIDWIIFGCSWATLIIYLYRLYTQNDVLNLIKTDKKQISLQLIGSWNEQLANCVGIASFLGIFKFLRLLRLHAQIAIIVNTLKISMKETVSFIFFFTIVWGSFIQIIYLVLNENTYQFSTVVKTFETTYAMILNKLPPGLINGQNSLFGSLICVFFYVFVVFILLNLLISIITGYFDMIRKDKDLYGKNAEVIDYLFERLEVWITANLSKIKSKSLRTKAQIEPSSYLEEMNLFKNKTEKLIEQVDKTLEEMDERKDSDTLISSSANASP